MSLTCFHVFLTYSVYWVIADYLFPQTVDINPIIVIDIVELGYPHSDSSK